MRIFTYSLGFFLLANSYGCAPSTCVGIQQASAMPGESIGSVKDLMQYEVDPSADAVWDSVSTVVNSSGIHENKPRTENEWAQVRGQAIVLAEAANLLATPGRVLALPTQKIDGEGAPGNLTTETAQRILQVNHSEFVAFARALQLVAVQAAKAAESKDVKGLLDSGEALDNACEACHLKFWYPESASAGNSNSSQFASH